MKIRLHDGYKKFLDALAEGPVIVTGYTRYTTVSRREHQGYAWATITMTMHRELKQTFGAAKEPVVQFERKDVEGTTRTVATLTERGKKVRLQGWFVSVRN